MKHERLILTIVLIAAFLLRLGVIPPLPDFTPSDMQRDYLIASHIATYHEFPLRGPDGYLEGLMPSSPIYYYLFAAFLLVTPSATPFVIANVAFQLVFLWAVWALARAVFSPMTALLSLLLAAFGGGFVAQSAFVWQPTIAQPVLYVAYVFLFWGYQKRALAKTVTGVLLYLLALALGPSTALSVSPMIAVFVIASVARVAHPIKQIVLMAGATIAWFSLLFVLPFTLRIAGDPAVAGTWNGGVLMQLLGNLASRETVVLFAQRFSVFARFFLPSYVVFLTGSLILLFTYISTQPSKAKRRYFLFLLLAVAQVIILATFIPTKGIPLPNRFFIPVFGLFVVWAAEAIVWLVGFVRPWARLLVYLAVVATLAMYIPVRPHSTLPPPVPGDALDALTEEIISIRKAEGHDNYHFFAFRMFVQTRKGMLEEDEFTEIPLFIQLEDRLNTKLVAVDDTKLWGYVRLGEVEPRYVFLVCTGGDCRSSYSSSQTRYTFARTIFSNVNAHIHVFAREDQP